MIKPRFVRAACWLLVAGLFAAPARAQQDTAQDPQLKFYDVEVIVFRNDKVPRGQEFNLPTTVATPTENTLDFTAANAAQQAAAVGFTLLQPDDFRLLDQVERIVSSSRYNLLIHTAWRQPGLDETSSIPVWIRGGQLFGDSYSSIDQFSRDARLPTGSERATAAVETPVTSTRGFYELEGMITVSLSRYLHTHAQLVLRKPAKPMDALIQRNMAADFEPELLEPVEGQLLLNYALDERRRMRSKRLHYLDHPQFGMLVLITPFEPAVELPASEGDGLEPLQNETTDAG